MQKAIVMITEPADYQKTRFGLNLQTEHLELQI